MSPLGKAIYNIVIYLPLVVLVAGILVGVIAFRRDSLLSVLAIVAFSMRLFLDWLSPHMYGWIQSSLQETRISPLLWMNYYMAWFLLQAILMASSYILIIISIFMRRINPKKDEAIVLGQPSLS
jgi:predicted membrane protein